MTVDDAINFDDLRKLAKKRLPKIIYDFIEGGVDDEDGLDRNEDAFRRRPLMPRYMVDITTRDQSQPLFGRQYSSPFGIAPTGGISNYRWGGDLMLAEAARDANIPFIMSGAATASMEDLAKVAPDHGWYQLYVAQDRAISEDMIRKAADLGLSTLVVTVDVPTGSNRERNRRNGFGRPLKLSLASKLDALRRPFWFKDYMTHGIAKLPNWEPYAPAGVDANGLGDFVSSQIRGSLSWADIEDFRKLWPRKMVLKGVMRTDDAIRAAEIGVDGLMVSNHGARQLDRAPSPLDGAAIDQRRCRRPYDPDARRWCAARFRCADRAVHGREVHLSRPPDLVWRRRRWRLGRDQSGRHSAQRDRSGHGANRLHGARSARSRLRALGRRRVAAELAALTGTVSLPKRHVFVM